jgi:hypothetical protein
MRAAIPVVFLLTCLASLNAQEQTGTIAFYREPHFASGDFKPLLFCDNTELARIENGTYFQVTAPAGLHTCTVESLRGSALEVNVLAGKSAYVHVKLLPGIWDHAELANTSEEEYNKAKARLKPVKDWSRDTLRTAQPPGTNDSSEASNAPPVAPSKQSNKSKASKFGDLSVNVSKLVITPAGNIQDRDELAAFFSVANTGKGVVCASLEATLSTTFDLKYRGFTGGLQASYGREGFPPVPRMNEMLPGESAEGSYVFEIKHGVDPLELVIKLTSRQYGEGYSVGSIRCGSNMPLHDVFVPDEIRFDLRDMPITNLQSPR